METMTPQHYEYTIDGHQTRCEIRLNHGEWSAYSFVDPCVDKVPSPTSARDVLPKLLRALADDLEQGVQGNPAPR